MLIYLQFMRKEFHIPTNIVDEIKWRIHERLPSASVYIDHMRKLMSESPSCRLLHDSLLVKAKGATDGQIFWHGAALGFDATYSSSQWAGVDFEITPQGLALHETSVVDYTGVKMESDYMWPEYQFLERLKSSRQFVDFYIAFSGLYRNYAQRMSFRRGVYNAAMPIFAVIDTKDLNLLWGNDIPSDISLFR